MKTFNGHLKTVARILFGCLLAIELLAWVGVLSIHLDFTWLGLIVTLSASWITVETVIRYCEKRSALAWSGLVLFTTFTSLAIDAAGDMNRWYSRFLWYDQFAHLAGGVTTMIFVSFAVSSYFHIHGLPFRGKAQWLFSLGLATLIGVLYEIEEFTEDYLTQSHRFGDAQDTISDLAFNFGGASIIGAVIFFFLWRVHQKITYLNSSQK